MSSSTSLPEPPTQGVSSESGLTAASRPLQPVSDPSASKRVCFYKSGDLTFGGHRMVINARTFKTYDALLDALSKKVPLPFGVRTITTPHGTHTVKSLTDLHDGGSYVCSDQKRVKPLDLDAVNRRQVPWNTTRPVSARRRGRRGLPIGRRNEANSRPARITDRVAVRTPKRLVVIKNRDPTVKRTVVLQKRTAPTFDALLDYLSQTMQFRVLKLYSADGRRLDGLAALILCSGVIVAAGNEPFRALNNQPDSQRMGQMAQSIYSDAVEPSRLQPQAQKRKSYSNGRASRNFSLSSERYIVNQINKSRNSSTYSHSHRHSGSYEIEVNPRHRPTDGETRERVSVEDGHQNPMVPQDDDIETSFRVNQDGSMTVEMKVHLSIKEEELLHWTTTLSRSSLTPRTTRASNPGVGDNSPDSNNSMANDMLSGDETKEDNHHTGTGKGVGFSDGRRYEGYSPAALGKPKSSLKRPPTPGPRHIKKMASIESVQAVTESGVQESTLGRYSYKERTADSETTEGYCVVQQSNRPIPKPRKTASAGAHNRESSSSIRSTGVAEVLQIQNNGPKVTETVMHICEKQDCYDNYLANDDYSSDGIPKSLASMDAGPYSSSYCDCDCDVDFTQQSSTTDSRTGDKRRKEEILSLSSDPMSPTHKISNNLSPFTDNEVHTVAVDSQVESTPKQTVSVKKDNAVGGEMQEKAVKPTGKQKSSSSSGSGIKRKDSTAASLRNTRRSSADKPGNVTLKKNGSISESKNFLKNKGAEKLLTNKNVSMDDTIPSGKQALSLNIESTKGTLSRKQLNMNRRAAKDTGHNLNTPETKTARPPMKKNTLGILQPKRSSLPGKKAIAKQKSMNENRMTSPKQTLELNESISMPAINPTSSDVHQYVENWLQKINPDSVPYIEETAPTVVFQIGDDSETETKSDCQVNAGEHCLSHGDNGNKSMSCLSVVRHERLTLDASNNGQRLCASMPSVRVDPVDQESGLGTHRSAEAICPIESESPPYMSSLLSPNARIEPILRQICSSIQLIRRASEPEQLSNIEKLSSLPDFSSQVATVFGSTSKVFLSFLSVMSLQDTLTSSVAGEDSTHEDSKSASEAMLVMESLQRISTIEDKEELRASLTDLENRTSFQFRERWIDFQVQRERLESEALSPKFSEQEFLLDVLTEGGHIFDDQRLCINELMEELDMLRDISEQISSTVQQTKSFYPETEDSTTCIEKERHHTDSGEQLELLAKEHDNITRQSSEPDLICIAETTAETFVEEENKNDILAAGEIDDSEHDPGEEIDPEAEETEPASTLENISELGSDSDVCGSTKSMSGDGETEEEQEGEGVGGVGKEAEKGRWEENEEEEEADDGDKREVKDREEEDDKGEEGDGMEEREEEEAEDGDKGEVKDREEEDDKGEEGDGMEEREEERQEVDEEGGEVSEREEELQEEEEYEEENERKGEEEVEADVEEEERVDGEEVVEVEEVIEEDEKKEDEGGLAEDEAEEGDEFVEDKETDDVKVSEVGEEEEEGIGQSEEKGEKTEEAVEGDEVDEREDKGMGEEQDMGEYRRGDEEEAVREEEEEEREEEVDVDAQHEVEEEEEEGERDNDLDAGCEHMEEREPTLEEDEEEEGVNEPADADNIADSNAGERILEEASYLRQQSSREEAWANNEESDADTKGTGKEVRSSYNSSLCDNDNGHGTDTTNGLKTDDGEEEQDEEVSSSLSHPVEISQDLLDFVNSALQSSSLIFTYDARGNVRIEPDNVLVVRPRQIALPKSKEDSQYGLKRLPSPNTSDLSDYRPETSESGGYKSQGSIDVSTESGEERQSPGYRGQRCITDMMPNRRTNEERGNSKRSSDSKSDPLQSPTFKSGRSHPSYDSGTKASGDDLSYFSAASSFKADAEPTQYVSFISEADSHDGVLIDQGRWLLKENHLIRNSPPDPLGMYDNADMSSTDTGENTSGECPPHYATKRNPLAAISSSELEDMAKPQTPKCSYYNMPHGSDSDPFQDEFSVKSGDRDSPGSRGKGLRIPPTVDTSKNWTKKNGSLSSFASVEFKMPDSRVHPEEESSAVAHTRRPSSVASGALHTQDSLHVRCGQLCPIL